MQWRNQSHRPKAITILSILQIISSIFMLIGGLAMLVVGGLGGGGFFAILGLIYIPLGILFAFVGYGLYSGKGWAWKYAVIAQVIGIPLSLIITVIMPLVVGGDVGSSVIGSVPGIIIGIITLSYMLRPRTRAYFGKVQLDV
jgi:hypothetical protein